MPVINTYLYCFPQHFLLLFKILRIIVNCNGWMILLFTASRSYITNVKLKIIIIMAGFLISNKYIFSMCWFNVPFFFFFLLFVVLGSVYHDHEQFSCFNSTTRYSPSQMIVLCGKCLWHIFVLISNAFCSHSLV